MFSNEEFENLEFDTAPRRFPIKVKCKTKENEPGFKVYVLIEMNSEERDKYMDAMNKKMPGGKISLFEGLQADLLGRCMLVAKDPDSEGKKEDMIFSEEAHGLVNLEELLEGYDIVKVDKRNIQGWPCNMQQTLFDKARKLCGLVDEKERQKFEDEIKNS